LLPPGACEDTPLDLPSRITANPRSGWFVSEEQENRVAAVANAKISE
jgi:hypothetical protein